MACRARSQSGACSTVFGTTETDVITEIGRRLTAGRRPDRGSSRSARGREERLPRVGLDVLVIEPTVENLAEESTRLRQELDDLRTPIDVVVVAEDIARGRAVVRGTVVDRALREGRVLAHT
jgi:hypothetical protein